MESSEESFEIPEAHSQLTKAIHSYQDLLEKCKKVTRLGNYHKYYQKHLVKHCDKLKESQISKVQLLISPGVGTDHNFNLFRFLTSKLPKLNLSFPIIDTLILSPQEQNFIRNDLEGKFEQHSNHSAVQEFFKRLRFGNDGIPVCLAKPDNGKLLLFDSVLNVSRFLLENPSFEGSLQSYVASAHLNIIRVHWKDSGQVRSFLIKKKNLQVSGLAKEQIKVKVTNKVFASTEASEDDSLKLGQTDEECLNYAFGVVKKHKRAQLRRISFLNDNTTQELPSSKLFSIYEHPVNSFPSLSSFLEQVAKKCKDLNVHPWNAEEPETLHLNEKDAEKFLVLGTDPEHLEVTELKTVYHQVFTTLMKVAALVDRHLLKQKKSLKEISLDFLKDRDWRLFKVHDIKINESLADFREISAPFNKLSFSSFVPPLKNQNKKLDMLCVKIRNIPSKRPDPPLLHKRTMMSTQTPMPIRYPVIKEKAKGSISGLREKFDSFLKKTEDLQVFDNLKLDQQKQTLIENYLESFTGYAKNLKEIEAKKSLNNSEVSASFNKEIKGKTSSFNLKPVMKEYNSMMIHVRRVNMKKKKPLIENYGGEDFFRNIIKNFCQRVVSLENINKRVSAMSREVFHGMFLKGLGCVFNSNLTLNFRQLVRQRHKNLGIDSETYKSFCGIFMVVLQEAKILPSDLEVINDNLLSFSGSICCPGKNSKQVDRIL
jgi:hypothetical protein